MADDHDALLAEVDIRAPDDSGRWSGNYKLMMSDPTLARALAAAVRDLQAEHEHCGSAADTLQQARELAVVAKTEPNMAAAKAAVLRLVDLLVDGGGDG
jgi:hypothetical protein